MLLTGTCDVDSFNGRRPPEPFRGLLAPVPPGELSDLLMPANEGEGCCCGCGWSGCCCCCCGCGCSRGRPGAGVGDMPPWVGTVVGDRLFWIWLDNAIDEKLFNPGTGMLLSPGTERFAPQLLLLPGMLAGPPLFPKPPSKLAGTLLFFDWTLTYGLKWDELDWEWLLPLLSLLFDPRTPGRGGWEWGVSRTRLSPCWQSVAQPWNIKSLRYETFDTIVWYCAKPMIHSWNVI